MFDPLMSAVSHKVGDRVGELVAQRIGQHAAEVTDPAPALLAETEIDAIARRIRRKQATRDRLERENITWWNFLAGGLGVALGFCVVSSVISPSRRPSQRRRDRD